MANICLFIGYNTYPQWVQKGIFLEVRYDKGMEEEIRTLRQLFASNNFELNDCVRSQTISPIQVQLSDGGKWWVTGVVCNGQEWSVLVQSRLAGQGTAAYISLPLDAEITSINP